MATKKILFFIPVFPVLSETFIEREVCELYKRKNIELQIISLKKGNTDLSCTELENSISYLNLTPFDILIGLAYFTARNPVGLLQTRVLSLKNKRRWLFGNLYLWIKSVGYAYIISKFKAQHIHAHFFSESSTIALFAAILLKIPFSVSGHARDVFGTVGVVPELVPEKLSYAKFVALCNKKAFDHSEKLASENDKNKLHLISHGLEIIEVPVNAAQNETAQIYFLGRFVEKKGIIYLLQAVKILKEQGEKVFLTLSGYGPMYKPLRKLCIDMHLDDCVSFSNDGEGVDNKTALEEMKKADIFVMPSVDLDSGDSDGIPNNILEAGLCSKPVIVTDAGSIVEVIVDKENGLIVPQKDSVALASAIKELIHDNALSLKLGTNLHEVVKNRFDIKQNIVELERLLIE